MINIEPCLEQLVESEDPHPLDVEVGDGGGQVEAADEAEAREVSVIAGLVRAGAGGVLVKSRGVNNPRLPHQIKAVLF